MPENTELQKPVVHWQRTSGPLRPDTVVRLVCGLLLAAGLAYILVSTVASGSVRLQNDSADSGSGSYTVTCGPLWAPAPDESWWGPGDSVEGHADDLDVARFCDRHRDRTASRAIALTVPTVLLGAVALRPR